MRYCQKCGAQNAEDATFCVSCGEELTASTNSQEFTKTGTTVVINNNTTGYAVHEIKQDKNIFVWVFAFLLGGFGVDRFVRGQIGVGICKLLFGWMTFGIWALVDWIIAMVKAYGGNSFGDEAQITFINGKYAK